MPIAGLFAFGRECVRREQARIIAGKSGYDLGLTQEEWEAMCAQERDFDTHELREAPFKRLGLNCGSRPAWQEEDAKANYDVALRWERHGRPPIARELWALMSFDDARDALTRRLPDFSYAAAMLVKRQAWL